MDVTFVLEESGATATVEVPCDVDAAAAKEVACRALAVSPASVDVRIGTEWVEGTCRLQDTAFHTGVQVVLACRCADMMCPADYNIEGDPAEDLSLSYCGRLGIYVLPCPRSFVGFDTETFKTSFSFTVDTDNILSYDYRAPAISRCKTHCYVACENVFLKISLPGGEVLRRVTDSTHHSRAVFACGDVVVSQSRDLVVVYDKDLTFLRSIEHCALVGVAVSDCGGWMTTSSMTYGDTCLWNIKTGVCVACVDMKGPRCELDVAISRPASVFAMGSQLFDWSGTALGTLDVDGTIGHQFTPCGKYLVIRTVDNDYDHLPDSEICVLQYDVATMSCVRAIDVPLEDNWYCGAQFAISPCSRVVIFLKQHGVATRHLYPYNSDGSLGGEETKNVSVPHASDADPEPPTPVAVLEPAPTTGDPEPDCVATSVRGSAPSKRKRNRDKEAKKAKAAGPRKETSTKRKKKRKRSPSPRDT